tara:strand:+ start:1737 stop:2639 length:903 start_codon:yes stop_codon:yes gene_type:complete
MNFFSRLLVLLQLVLLVADGIAEQSVPQRHTTDGKWKQDLSFTHDSHELVFSTLKTNQLIKLERLNLQTGKRTDFHGGANTNEISISFARDMKFYAYVRNDGNLHTSVEVQDVEAGEKHTLNPGGGFACVRAVTIRPDGREVIYSFPVDNGSQQLWRTDHRLQNKKALTKSDYIDTHPRYSPNGAAVVFTSTRAGNFDIYRMAADGTNLIQLTEHAGLDTRAAWSPDGMRIAYTSLREGNYDIYVMDAFGAEGMRVTTNPGKDDFVTWHPNGREIYFSSEVKGKIDIYSLEIPAPRTRND